MRKGAAEPVRVVPSSAIRVTSTFADVAYFKGASKSSVFLFCYLLVIIA